MTRVEAKCMIDNYYSGLDTELINKIYDDFEQELKDYVDFRHEIQRIHNEQVAELEQCINILELANKEYEVICDGMVADNELLKQRIAELKSPKTCEGCKHMHYWADVDVVECTKNEPPLNWETMKKLSMFEVTYDFGCINYEPKKGTE